MTTVPTAAIIQLGPSQPGILQGEIDTVTRKFAQTSTSAGAISPAVVVNMWNQGQALALLTNATWLSSAGVNVSAMVGYVAPLTPSSLPGISPLLPGSVYNPPNHSDRTGFSIVNSGSLGTGDFKSVVTLAQGNSGKVLFYIDGRWITETTSNPATFNQTADYEPGTHSFEVIIGWSDGGTNGYQKFDISFGTVPPPPPPSTPSIHYALVEVPTIFQPLAVAIPKSLIVSTINMLAVTRQNTGWRALDAAWNPSTKQLEIQMEKYGSIPFLAIAAIIRAALWLIGIISAVIIISDVSKTIQNGQTQSTLQGDTDLITKMGEDGVYTPEEVQIALALINAHKPPVDNGENNGPFGEIGELIKWGIIGSIAVAVLNSMNNRR